MTTEIFIDLETYTPTGRFRSNSNSYGSYVTVQQILRTQTQELALAYGMGVERVLELYGEKKKAVTKEG